MKTIIYFFLIVFSALSMTSCDDNDENLPSLTGNWNYSRPYFEFDYAADSIVIEMYKGQKKAIAVDQFKESFNAQATEKMKDYFKGIEVLPENRLRIQAQLQTSAPLTIGAGYHQTKDFIQVTLDQEDMKKLLGEKAGMIPAISFRYSLRETTLTMYFDEAYVRTIYAMMESQLVPMIVDMMDIDFTHMPEGTEQLVIDGIKKQIPLILDKIIRLQIGFVLTKE